MRIGKTVSALNGAKVRPYNNANNDTSLVIVNLIPIIIILSILTWTLPRVGWGYNASNGPWQNAQMMRHDIPQSYGEEQFERAKEIYERHDAGNLFRSPLHHRLFGPTINNICDGSDIGPG